MSDLAIRVQNISKRYQLGAAMYRADTLRDELAGLAQRLLQRGGGQDLPESDNIFWALKDVSFELKYGEVLGIIGRNGAGKSTILKILSRITRPSSGTAEIYGRVASLLEVGTGFHSELTGRENIFLNGAVLGMRRAEVKRLFDEIVDFAEIEQFLDTPVKRYSSGMYTRLAFAVAAHLETDVLLVDEVLAVGDTEFQKKCLGKMGNLAESGRAVVFVSHNMGVVARLCNRAMLLNYGQIAHTGDTHEVIQKYLGANLQQAGECVWKDPATAPGNDLARLRAVRTRNKQGEIQSEFSVTEPFTIEIEYAVSADTPLLTAAIGFNDSQDNTIFVAFDLTKERKENNPITAKGVHTACCQIPANLLNAGAISVAVSITKQPNVMHAIEYNIIRLFIADSWDWNGARGGVREANLPGAIRPLLDWSADHRPFSDEE